MVQIGQATGGIIGNVTDGVAAAAAAAVAAT